MDGGVIDRHDPLYQHQLQVAVENRELQVSAHRRQDHLRSELTPLERVLSAAHTLSVSFAPKHGILASPLPHEKLQQNLHDCPGCGTVEDRDVHSGKVVKHRPFPWTKRAGTVFVASSQRVAA